MTESHKAAGTASFEVGIANFSTLGDGESVTIMFDTDRTPTTGVEGFEYALLTDGSLLGGGFALVVSFAEANIPDGRCAGNRDWRDLHAADEGDSPSAASR